jgi:hypothetical protein
VAFPKINCALKGRRFQDTERRSTTEVPEMFPTVGLRGDPSQ